MPGSFFDLRRGSTSDLPGLSQRKASKRRFSLLNVLMRKSTTAINQSGIEEHDENENRIVNKHNERLLLSFSDAYNPDVDYHDNRVCDVDNTISYFGRKGKAKGEYQDAKDITMLSGNRLLITDLINGRIQMCNLSGSLLLMFSGSDVSEPWGIASIDNRRVAVTSRKSKCVRVLDLDGEITKSFGENFFSSPAGIAVDKTGNFIVCDAGANTVTMHNTHGDLLCYLEQNRPNESLRTPRYVCVSSTGDVIISDSGNHKIKIFNSKGKFKRSFGSFGKTDGKFKCPYGVCTYKYGEIIVADHYNNRVSMFSSHGVFQRHLVTSEDGLRHPQGVSLKGSKLFISHGDLKASEILVYIIPSKIGCDKDTYEHNICHL